MTEYTQYIDVKAEEQRLNNLYNRWMELPPIGPDAEVRWKALASDLTALNNLKKKLLG